MINRLIEKLSDFSFTKLVLISTVFVLSGSIPTVYLFAMAFSQEYTSFLLMISVFLPMILTPPVTLFLLTASKNLKYINQILDVAVEKNKQNDLLLFEQARFVLMGEMMANISHQWKQPLNTISLSIVNLKLEEKSPEESHSYYDIMEKNINYLVSTIDDFMSFFDKKVHSECRSIGSIMQEVKSIVEAQLSNKKIDLEIVIDIKDTNLMIASSISQVIINLINNAKDAFGSMSTEKEVKEVKILFSTNKDGLEIECIDNAGGIAQDIKEKVFDPYFTTKHKTQGIGIGLYMSREIIQKIFHGNIRLESNGNGTSFIISLPYSDNCYNEES